MKQKRIAVKRLILPIVLVLIIAVVTLTATGVFASLGDTTSVMTVKPGQVGCSVTKDYSVRSTGTVSCLLRAKIVVNWLDEDGNIVAAAPENAKLTITTSKEWAQRPEKTQDGTKPGVDEGYWYFTGVAQPGETYRFLEQVKVEDGKAKVTVLAEALQATPAEAVQEAWGMQYQGGNWK